MLSLGTKQYVGKQLHDTQTIISLASSNSFLVKKRFGGNGPLLVVLYLPSDKIVLVAAIKTQLRSLKLSHSFYALNELDSVKAKEICN